MTDADGEAPDPPSTADSAPALVRYLDLVLSPLDKGVSWVIIAAMAVLTTVIVAQVFLRYVLNTSLDWGWEVPRLCFIWVIFLSIPLGIRRGVHVGIDIVMHLLPKASRRALFRLHLVLIAGLMAVVTYFAISLTAQTWDQLMPTLELSVGVFYVALAWSGVHSILHLFRLFCLGRPSLEGVLGEL